MTLTKYMGQNCRKVYSMCRDSDIDSTSSLPASPEIARLMEGGYRASALGGWHRISICGTPYQLGFQHGYLLAPEIIAALESNKFWAHWLTAQPFDFFAEHALEIYVKENLIAEDLLEELKGITAGIQAAGHEVEFSEIVAYNCFVEVVFNAFGSLKKDIKHSPPPARPRQFVGHCCSAFIATGGATAQGQIVMAHNTWDAYIQGQHFNCIVDMNPDRGHRMVMQASPGYIASMTDFVLTGSGLMVTETTIDGHSGFNIKKPPAACTARTACQYANSIDEWWSIMLEGNNAGYANSWLLGDRSSGEIARGEIGLDFYNLDRTSSGVFHGQNIPENLSIRNLETRDPDAWSDVSGSGARRVRWRKMLAPDSAPIDIENARCLISDHYDEFLKKEQASSRTICGHLDEDNGMHSTTPGHPPYYPWGTLDAKVADSISAENMYFEGRWGRACGEPFMAEEFLKNNPQYDWLEGKLMDRPAQNWQQLKLDSTSTAFNQP